MNLTIKLLQPQECDYNAGLAIYNGYYGADVSKVNVKKKLKLKINVVGLKIHFLRKEDYICTNILTG